MASSIAKHIIVILFASFAYTIGHTNWSYVNSHVGNNSVEMAVAAEFIGSFLLLGAVWVVGVLIWRGVYISLRKAVHLNG